MSKESQNSSKVGFYLLPRAGREPSPPAPHHLQHRLSIIREVSEESSAASTPQSSPSHNPLRRRKHGDQKSSETDLHRHVIKERRNRYSGVDEAQAVSFYHSNTLVPAGDIENFTSHEEIVIHTSGRGDGCQNKSSMR